MKIVHHKHFAQDSSATHSDLVHLKYLKATIYVHELQSSLFPTHQFFCMYMYIDLVYTNLTLQ